MTLEDGHWEIWREARPALSNASPATSRTMVGRSVVWEASEDGSTLEYDFDVSYSKIV